MEYRRAELRESFAYEADAQTRKVRHLQSQSMLMLFFLASSSINLAGTEKEIPEF